MVNAILIRRILTVVALVCIGAATSSSCLHGNIVYHLVDYPTIEDSCSLSGTITTDGKLGGIMASDIVAWDFAISSWPATITSESSTDPLASITSFDSSSPVLNATATSLSVPYGNGFNLSAQDHSDPTHGNMLTETHAVDWGLIDTFSHYTYYYATSTAGAPCFFHYSNLVSYQDRWPFPAGGYIVGRAANPSWASAVDGNWRDRTNWTDSVPNAVGACAILDSPVRDSVAVALDVPVALGVLQFGNSANSNTGFTLSGGGTNTLTLDNSGIVATIMVTDGAHSINAPVVLADNLVVTNSDARPWAFSFGTASTITQSGTGSYSLTMNGMAGTLVLAGSSVYTGGTIISAGTLQIGRGGTTGSIIGDVTNNSALVFNRSDNITFPGVITGTGCLTQAGPGVLTLSGSSLFWGPTTISGGTLNVLGNYALQGSTVTMTGGSLTFDENLWQSAVYIGGLSGSGELALQTDAPTSAPVLLFANGNWSDSTYSGTITGPGSLTKIGAGRLVLSGSNTYAGGTNVLLGVLEVTRFAALPDGASLTVGANAASIFGGAAVPASSPAAVPEPPTLALLGASIVGLLVCIRRRRRPIADTE